MAYFGNIRTNNQGMINQLMRQKENIENMITQYSQPPAPVQTIINTGSNNFEFEARILKDDEDISNIAIMRKTLFKSKDMFNIFTFFIFRSNTWVRRWRKGNYIIKFMMFLNGFV